MSVKRDMAKRPGIDLQILHENLVNASGDDAVAEAAVLLGCRFNEEIEFIISVLKQFGGMKVH